MADFFSAIMASIIPPTPGLDRLIKAIRPEPEPDDDHPDLDPEFTLTLQTKDDPK